MEIVLVSDRADAILQTVQKLGVYFPDRGERKGYSTFRKPGTNKGGLPLSESLHTEYGDPHISPSQHRSFLCCQMGGGKALPWECDQPRRKNQPPHAPVEPL